MKLVFPEGRLNLSLPKNTSHSHDGGDDGKLQAGRFLCSLRRTTEEEEWPSQLLATEGSLEAAAAGRSRLSPAYICQLRHPAES